MLSFKLDNEFIQKYCNIDPPFGFNGLGEVVYQRSYSRLKEDGKQEDWFETIRRVVEGTYSIQKDHINLFKLGWNESQGQQSAQEMYDKIFNMKFLPPGRGLWAMGTSIVHKKQLAASLNNCAFVSTEVGENEPSTPFEFLFDASMLGVGVGFDTKGAGKIKVIGPLENIIEHYKVEDTREGWVISLHYLLRSYLGECNKKCPEVEIDFSLVRPSGVPLKTFGGLSSGPEPLIELHNKVREILRSRIGSSLSSRDIVDIFNLIGRCVIAGNIRRAAEIAFGEADDENFLDLKNYEKHPERAEFGWTSNNSVFAKLGMDYKKIAERICHNGEPGICWLENMQNYGRMIDPPNDNDKRVKGGNPCLEQSLESFEMCCLVETFPARHETLEEYLRTLKFAYLYAKTVTLRMTHWPETNKVMLRNRRIGCSVSGVAQFLSKHSLDTLKVWLERSYETVNHWDKIYSSWFCIPPSIKMTSIKPSGTVSLLAGSTSGMHYPEARYYIRRIIIQKDSLLIDFLAKAGYKIEVSINEPNSVVVEFPIDVGEGVRTIDNVPMYEQLSLARFLQEYWADNQVSCTITFDLEREGPHIAQALDYFQYYLKGVSFYPKMKDGKYKQVPYEEIDEEEYMKKIKEINKIEFFERKDRVVDLPECSESNERNYRIYLSGKDEDEMNIIPMAVRFCSNAGCM